MPKNKQYLAVKLLKVMNTQTTNRKFEQAAARYLDHTYDISDIKKIILRYK